MQHAHEHGLKWEYEHADLPPPYLQRVLNTTIKSDAKDFTMEIKSHRLLEDEKKLTVATFQVHHTKNILRMERRQRCE